MKTPGFVKYIATALLLIGSALAQNPSQPQPFSITTMQVNLLNPPVAPAGLTISQVGAPGSSALVYYYWAVARTAIGNSSPSGPVIGFNANSTLNSSNYFNIAWQTASGATGYDVLRTSTPTPPTGACACAVTTNTSSLQVNDQSNSLSAYTVNTLDPNSLQLQLANEAQSGGGSHYILRQNGVLVQDLSAPLAGSAAFSTITPGTNTGALRIGTGGSLDVTGSGTLNSTSMLGFTWALPGFIGSTTPNSAILTSLSSDQSIDLSDPRCAGTHWTDKLVACYGVLGGPGGTITIPDSQADSGPATTPTIPSTVTIVFAGSATFTECTMNARQFSHILLGKATLRASGSNCSLINQIDISTEQNAQKFLVEGGTLDCNSQIACTGVRVGNHTNTVIRNVSYTNMTDTTSSISTPTGGLVFQATQFAKVENNKFYNVYVPHKCYNDASGGGCNSNEYDNLNIASGCQVGVQYGTQGTSFQIGPNYFHNNTIQNCAITSMAVFGNTSVCGGSGCGAQMYVYGGAPELNATGGASVTIDGFTSKHSSTYVSYTNLFYTNVGVQEATATPIIAAENNSNVVLVGETGGAGQTFTTTDAGSKTYQIGPNLSPSTVFGNLVAGTSWDAIANPAANQTLTMGANTTTWNWSTANTNALRFINSTAAINGTNQPSPVVSLCGQYWTGVASAQDCITLSNSFNNSSNPNAVLAIGHSGSSGGVAVSVPSNFAVGGNTTLAGTLQVSSSSFLVGGASVGSSSQTQFNSVGLLTKYNNINAVNGGIPAEYATVDLTAQSAAISATTVYAATASAMYRVCWTSSITTAGTSSTLGGAGGFQVLYTSPTDSVVKTTITDANETSTANTTGTAVGGCKTVFAKTGTNIQYQFGYTSSGTTMVYELHAKVEQL